MNGRIHLIAAAFLIWAGISNSNCLAVIVNFDNPEADATRLAVNPTGVDRIVLESFPVNQAARRYAMDDLTYNTPEPATVVLLAAGGLLLLQSPLSRRRRAAHRR